MDGVVYPKRNLPNDAEPWGRTVETEQRSARNKLNRVEQTLNNSERGFSGQLAVLTNNVQEFFNRSVEFVSFPSISVTGNATIEPFPRATVSANNVSKDATRAAFIWVSGTFNEDPQTGSVVYVEVILNGETIIYGEATQSYDEWPPNFGPPAPRRNLAVYSAVTIPAGVSTISIRIVRVGFTGTVSTWTSTDLQAAIYYGDRV